MDYTKEFKNIMPLYPKVNTKNFNREIMKKFEFLQLSTVHKVNFLYKHQEFIRRFMAHHTPYNKLLLYHNVGSGKTFTCVSICEDYFKITNRKSLVIVKGETGVMNFKNEIEKWYKEFKDEEALNNINITIKTRYLIKKYKSFANYLKRTNDNKQIDTYSKRVIILDEVHNVRSKKDKSGIYTEIYKFLHIINDCKIILATATPMSDSIEQLNPILNLILDEEKRIPDGQNPIELLEKFNGLISCNFTAVDAPLIEYVGKTIDGVEMPIILLKMKGHQLHYYKKDMHKKTTDIYKKKAQLSLFVTKEGKCGSKIINGESIKKIETLKTNKYDISHIKYYLCEQMQNDIKNGLLGEYSCKYDKLIKEIEKDDKCLSFVFMEEVTGSGALLLCAIFECFGYEYYNGRNLEEIGKGKRFTCCVGDKKYCPNLKERLSGFNNIINKYGEYVKVIIGSKIIGESITLKNVKKFHILSTHWNDSLINQSIGRVVRSNSHKDLGNEGGKIKVFIYASILEDDINLNKSYDMECIKSMDIKKLSISKTKHDNIKDITSAIEKISIDYYVNTFARINIKEENLDISTFINYHLDDYINDYIYYINDILKSKKKISIEKICLLMNKMLKINKYIVYEIIDRIIIRNISFQDKVIRYWGNFLYKTKDFTTPHLYLPYDLCIKPNNYENSKNYSNYFKIEEKKDNYIKNDDLETICNNIIKEKGKKLVKIIKEISIKDKSRIIELSIEKKYNNILHIFRYSILKKQKKIYHFMNYREKYDGVYGATSVPMQTEGKTRVYFINKCKWKNLNKEKEKYILLEYKSYVIQLDENLKWKIYGILCSTDGLIRLRDKKTENKEKSTIDTRFKHKGRVIKSYKIERLKEIAIELKIVDSKNLLNLSINNLSKIIENKIIEQEKFVIM